MNSRPPITPADIASFAISNMRPVAGATLHVLPSAQLQDVPEMLRRLADAIEEGKYGGVHEAAVVLGTDQVDRIEVFGFGRADGTVAHYLLGCGMAQLQRPRLGDG